MLERLLPFWRGKLFVLVLLGFAATDFVITMTLSAADAAAHVVENPLRPGVPARPGALDHAGAARPARRRVPARLRRGDRPRGRAGGCLPALNVVVHRPWRCGRWCSTRPSYRDWSSALTTAHGNPVMMVAVALMVFPQAGAGALRLRDRGRGDAARPRRAGRHRGPAAGRIRDTKKLLTWAAVHDERVPGGQLVRHDAADPGGAFEDGGAANGRALAYLAHEYLGNGFGTAYDVSTIAILWFAGASAMAGLLNLIPRYLPRYGMAPEWAGAIRPARAGAHRLGLPDHLGLRRRRERAGRCLRDRRPGADHQRRGRGDARRAPGAASGAARSPSR